MPDGLPLVVLLTLVIVARRMARANVMVKDLTIVETLGSVNMIASDKTGTLTQNKMSVVEILCGSQIYDSYPKYHQMLNTKSHPIVELVKITAICNRACFTPETKNLSPDQRKIMGDASDSALLNFSSNFFDVEEERENSPKVFEVPFNSKNKFMITIHGKNKDDECLFLMKGAAERMIEKCTNVLNIDGTVTKLTNKARKRLLDTNIEMCKKGTLFKTGLNLNSPFNR